MVIKRYLLSIIIAILPITKVTGQFSLITSSPERNSLGVSINEVIVLEFSDAVDQTTIINGLNIISNLRGMLTYNVNVTSSIVTIMPSEAFVYSEEISVTLLSSIKSISEISLTPITFKFKIEVISSNTKPPNFLNTVVRRNFQIGVNTISATDLDVDGDIDIVFAGRAIGWLENDGSGGFTEHTIMVINDFLNELTHFDIDQDRDIDLMITGSYGGIYILSNDGEQNFAVTSTISGNSISSLDIADFDHNGFFDIVYSGRRVPTYEHETRILYNQGSGLFNNIKIGSVLGFKNRSVDIDNDGDFDIVQLDGTGINCLLNSDNSFASYNILDGEYDEIEDINLSDLNNDHFIDIVMSRRRSYRIFTEALISNGSLQFTSHVMDSISYLKLVNIGDFDGDGDHDVVGRNAEYLFSMLENDGFANFGLKKVSIKKPDFTNNPGNTINADFDGDGDLDFATIIDSGIIECYINSIFPFNVSEQNDLINLTHGDADWGDFDNDGDVDLLMVGVNQNETATLLYKNVNGELIEVETDLPGVAVGSCDWGDYDNDGDLDILLMGATILSIDNRNPRTYIYENDGGNFSLLVTSEVQLPKAWHGKAKWADFNNDGWLDIVFNANGYSGIYQSDGNGNFTKQFDLPSVFSDGNTEVGDYDGDGDIDLAVSGWSGNDELGTLLKVYQNEGYWNFTEVQGDFVGRVGGNLNWADMDNDGDLDLVVSGRVSNYAGGSGSITVYRNNDNLFKLIENSELLYQADIDGTTATGDFNNDGVSDVIASAQGSGGNSAQITLLKNSGQGDLNVVDVVLPKIASRVANWVDYDLDHDLDIFVHTLLITNNNISKNTSPLPPSLIQVDSVYNNTIYLKWDTGSDLETNAKGLSYQIYLGTNPASQNIVNSNSDLTSGYRRVTEIGNSKGYFTRIENLKGGDYYFGVQSIDASFEGSSFTRENKVFVIEIYGNSGACLGLNSTYVAKPSGAYTWEVKGGAIVSGQGTDTLVVNWHSLGRGNVKVSNDQGDRNTLPIYIEEIPNPKIEGGIKVCTGLENYTNTDSLSYHTNWTVSGVNSIENSTTHVGIIEWLSSGQFDVIAQSYPEHKGCFTFDTLKVQVDQRPMPTIQGSGSTCIESVYKYTTQSTKPQWEVINGTLIADSLKFMQVKWTKLGEGYIILKEQSERAFCTSVDSMQIIINSIPAKPTLTLYQDTIILSSPSPSNYYSWYYNGEFVLGGSYIGIIPYVSGVFMVEVFNLNGCANKSDPFNFFITAIQQPEENEKKNFSIYPNPVDSEITLELDNNYFGDIELMIYSASSVLIKKIIIQKSDQKLLQKIDVSQLDSGYYIILIKTANNLYSSKFIKP